MSTLIDFALAAVAQVATPAAAGVASAAGVDPSRAATWLAGALAVSQALIKLGKSPIGMAWFDLLGKWKSAAVLGIAVLAGGLQLYATHAPLEAVLTFAVTGPVPMFVHTLGQARGWIKKREGAPIVPPPGGESGAPRGFAQLDAVAFVLALLALVSLALAASSCASRGLYLRAVNIEAGDTRCAEQGKEATCLTRAYGPAEVGGVVKYGWSFECECTAVK